MAANVHGDDWLGCGSGKLIPTGDIITYNGVDCYVFERYDTDSGSLAPIGIYALLSVSTPKAALIELSLVNTGGENPLNPFMAILDDERIIYDAKGELDWCVIEVV